MNRVSLVARLALCIGLMTIGVFPVAADDPSPPSVSLKLIFIHHSVGENWLADNHGSLGIALRDNGYFVSDTNYGWGPVCDDCENCWGAIGDCTDILHWDNWFDVDEDGPVFQALLNEYGQHSEYTRPSDPQPASENDIVLFKSCYPNSNLSGRPDDAVSPSRELTVGSAKAIYVGLLDQFAMRLDKLFVAITAPPVTQGECWEDPENARAFNNWLVHDWLVDHPYANVAVFDFYNVLTSNGGNASTNDSGQETGNHHRWWDGDVQHIQTVDSNLAAYPDGDSHPTPAGNRKATAEFVPLLNVFVNRWLGEQ
jgi:hypothetical protein